MSKNIGGYLRGPWWRNSGDTDTFTRRCYVIAWGTIVKSPAERYTDIRSVRFTIKTGRGAGRSEKHLTCVSYGESVNTIIMQAMEKGDIVLCCGTWIEKQYTNKKGERKTSYEMQVNYIIPFALVGFLFDLYGTPSISGAVEQRRNDDADIWESD